MSEIETPMVVRAATPETPIEIVVQPTGAAGAGPDGAAARAAAIAAFAESTAPGVLGHLADLRREADAATEAWLGPERRARAAVLALRQAQDARNQRQAHAVAAWRAALPPRYFETLAALERAHEQAKTDHRALVQAGHHLDPMRDARPGRWVRVGGREAERTVTRDMGTYEVTETVREIVGEVVEWRPGGPPLPRAVIEAQQRVATSLQRVHALMEAVQSCRAIQEQPQSEAELITRLDGYTAVLVEAAVPATAGEPESGSSRGLLAKFTGRGRTAKGG